MAWPYDAKHYTFAGNLYVPSATLNEMEDRIVDLHRTRTLVLYDAYSAESGSWVDTTHDYWQLGGYSSDAGLYFDFRAVEGMIITKVEAKVYNADGSSQTFHLAPFRGNVHFDVAATAPAWEGATDYTKSVATTAWDIITSGTVSLAITEGQKFSAKVIGVTVGDRIAGVQITYQPLTATE